MEAYTFLSDFVKEENTMEPIKKRVDYAIQNCKLSDYVNEINRAIDVDANDKDAWKKKAEIEVWFINYCKAFDCYKRVLDIDPSDTETLVIMVELNKLIQSAPNRVERITYLLEKRPDDACLWHMLLKYTDDKESLLKCYNRLSELEPDNEEILKRKCDLLEACDVDDVSEVDPNSNYLQYASSESNSDEEDKEEFCDATSLEL